MISSLFELERLLRVEFVPVLPPAYSAAVPKGWMDKRLPSCKIYLNSAFALDPAWIQPEEPRLLQGAEKPLLLSSRVALAVARPAAASRPLPTLLLAPQLLPGGCQNSLKAVGGSPGLALLALEPAAAQGPGPGPQPCPLLGCCPAKAPLLPSPCPGTVPLLPCALLSGSASRLDTAAGPLLPAQVTRVTAVTAPAVTLLATNLLEPVRAAELTSAGRAAEFGVKKELEMSRDGFSVLWNPWLRLKSVLAVKVPASPLAIARAPGALLSPVPPLSARQEEWKWTAMGCLESSPGTRAVSKGQEVAGGGSGDCSAVLACCEFIYCTLTELPSLTERGKESSRAACPPTLILHTTDRKSVPRGRDSGQSLCSSPGAPPGPGRALSSPWSCSCPGRVVPRCVVWTGDDRVFFFNASTQLSVWERPLALRHRGDIARLLEDPPHKRKLEAAATDKCVSSCPGDENDELSIKTKRNKTEQCQAAGTAGAEEEQAGEEGSAPRLSPPLEERITHFRDMLLERGVRTSPAGAQQLLELCPGSGSAASSAGALSLSPAGTAAAIFEQFVKTRVREEYKEKKNKLLLAKEEFKKLLEESKLSPRTTFKEFAEKHGRDQRFRLVQKKKDQEHFFNQFILILKKRDKENRIRLRKMR
ncbi:Transcription elongation regulator 1-like protein [Lonchura striata]|uniref:Transcription elongation regulator 1-like protein n=1 Tax=Lonchura striata TaxID=40157 RepID=A0A218U9T3_9PASE|nr:Transcription elongation regulator 1-like protein [Lonchura striata domestica]